jgi:tRNA-splicing ligase RtcB (3'-phosphate/5'-hydroxy nucleic acid ligase)
MARVIAASGRQRVPIAVWARHARQEAFALLERIAAQPYVFGHVAAMPDLHAADGVAVGTVFATEGVIVPSALGGDLGCGISALRFKAGALPLAHDDLERILAGWAERIPVGDAPRRGEDGLVPERLLSVHLSTRSLEHARDHLIPRQLGTLGGGNHFVELDRDVEGNAWLLIHTGSRGLGGAIGRHHASVAAAVGVGTVPGIEIASEAGRACVADVAWACAFAEANRAAIMEEAARTVSEVSGAAPDVASHVDVRHNFVAEEEHFGRRLWVHRKGAIAAPRASTVVIPGSMGTASYLAEGLGEATSFGSASHGAGRVMSRREARERIGEDRLERTMRRVVHDRRRARSLVEEAPAAYRDVREVLEDEADLVRPLVRLEPMVVLKG